MDVDVSMLADTSQELESSIGGVVQWVASQSTNPALRALMKEAERDKRTRPSTPTHEPVPWTYPLTSVTPSTSLSTPVSSAWHPSGLGQVDLLPLSASSSSTSSSSLATRASEPAMSRRAKPLFAVQRKPLASSTSSANQPLRHSARPRSSSHSTTLPNPSAAKEKYKPQDDEPEALLFIELLKDASRQVDENSIKKQRATRAKEKEKEREWPLRRGGFDNRTSLDTNKSSVRHLTKTSSASDVCPVKLSTKAPEKTLSTSTSAHKPELRGRPLTKMKNSGLPSIALPPGKSTPTLLPDSIQNRNPRLALAPRSLVKASSCSNANHATAREDSSPKLVPNDSDSAMQDVFDLTETDNEWEKPVSGLISRTDTTMCMELDDEESDTGMDVSFCKPEPPPETRVAAPKPKPQLPPSTRPLAPTQRTRVGPPPLGMGRIPQLQLSQYTSTQRSMVPPFKPPLRANTGSTTNKNGSGTRTTTTICSRQPPRSGTSKVGVAETAGRAGQDPDSSFDVSFGVDADALEEAMKAYD